MASENDALDRLTEWLKIRRNDMPSALLDYERGWCCQLAWYDAAGEERHITRHADSLGAAICLAIESIEEHYCNPDNDAWLDEQRERDANTPRHTEMY